MCAIKQNLFSLITIGLGCTIPVEILKLRPTSFIPYPEQTKDALSTNKFWKCGLKNLPNFNGRRVKRNVGRSLTKGNKTSEMVESVFIRGNLGRRNKNSRIVGGNAATPNKYPWQVGLSRDRNIGGDIHCGGSIISSKTILTAAHCLPTEWVLVGAKDRKGLWGDGYWIKVCNGQQGKHANYNHTTIDYDYAILTLCTEIAFNFKISPVCLPTAKGQGTQYEDKTVIASGWGNLNNHDQNQGQLQEVSMMSMSNIGCCSNDYKWWCSQITDRMICAKSIGKTMCQGDSGGPLVTYEDRSYKLIGVTSFNADRNCETEEYPGVYARVTNQLQWIKDKIQGQVAENPKNEIPALCRGCYGGLCYFGFYVNGLKYYRLDYYQGSLYYFHKNKESISWKQAESNCKTWFQGKASLAAVHSINEYNFIKNKIEEYKLGHLFLGGKRKSKFSNDWIWPDGYSMDNELKEKKYWSTHPHQQPDNWKNNENVLMMMGYQTEGQGLNDFTENNKLGSATFVCRLFC